MLSVAEAPGRLCSGYYFCGTENSTSNFNVKDPSGLKALTCHAPSPDVLSISTDVHSSSDSGMHQSSEESDSKSPAESDLLIASPVDTLAVQRGVPVQHKNVFTIRMTDQIRWLQTSLRDHNTSRSDFIFNADRLIRLIVEEGLNYLPYEVMNVKTPSGHLFNGLNFIVGNCGVSVIRSGEAMERGLRDCCRSIRIGKVLIQSDDDSNEANVLYVRLPVDIERRKVILMYPIVRTGNTVIKAIDVLEDHGVRQENIIFISLFATPKGVDAVMNSYPKITFVTSEIHTNCPHHFGRKYFGTD